MAEISPTIHTVNLRRAVNLYRREIVCPLLVAHIHYAILGEKHSVASVARRHHAVHHVDAALDCLENICRRTDSHKITGLVFWQYLIDNLDHLIHLLRRLANCQTANGIAVGTKIGDKLGRLLTKVFIDTALHNREICLTVAIFAIGCLIVVPSEAQPAQSQRQRLFGILIVGIARRTLVKRHHYVGTDGTLYVDHSLWREQMFRAVDV